MQITSFHIDGFGILSQVGVEQLPQGLSIFLGNNEAGKSTCLDFFRTMLTGYPQTRAKKSERNYANLAHSGQAGGFLGLQTNSHGLLRLTRRPQKSKDEIILTDAQGQILSPALLDGILSGITREVYRNVFGFSLNELQAFDSLDAEGVRHALYGASFGMGLRPPGKVLDELKNYMDKQFKQKGSTPELNAALAKLEHIQKAIQAAHATCARFDELSLEKEKLQATIQDLRAYKQSTELARHQAERQLGVWRQWDEWRSIESNLARLEEVVDSYPEDGPARLERAQVLYQEAARRVNTQNERCQKLEQAMASLEINHALLEQLPLLQSLSERKTSFRQAQSGLAPENANLQRSQAALAQYLSDLGPGWTCERIRNTDRSLFARGEMERQATEMQAAEQTHLAATHTLEKANAAVEHAEYEQSMAKKALDQVPFPPTALNDSARDDLRRSISTIENATTNLVEKQNTLQTATQSLQRALDPLKMRSSALKDEAQGMQKLERLLEQQEQALAIAEQCKQAQILTREAEQSVEQAQESEEMARGRLERARKQSHDNATGPKSALDTRAAAIRSLRTMYNNFSTENERLLELTERINSSIAPAPVKSIPLMIFGIIILAMGLAGLMIPMYFDITELQITPRLIIPLSQWSSYFVVVTGAAFLAGGLPRSGPESKRYVEEQKELELRSSNMRLRITEMEGSIQEQCVIGQVQAADNITLDAVELLLERQREQYAANERLGVEIEELDAEFNIISNKTKQKREALNNAQNNEQQARQKWHSHLNSHHVEAIPAPEAASTFFARVEAAILAYAAVQNLQEEIKQFEEQIHEHSQKLGQTPAVKEALVKLNAKSYVNNDNLSNDGSEVNVEDADNLAKHKHGKADHVQSILQASHNVLEACRAADEAQAQRLKAEALAHSAVNSREQAGKAQAEAIDSLHNSEKQLELVRVAWQERLKELNMDSNVSPAMLRAALDSMERCLAVELEISNINEEKQRLENECAALIKPLGELLQKLGLNAPQTTSDMAYQEDWLAMLDNLLFEAQNSQENSRLLEQYKIQLNTQEEELHEASTALSDAKATEDNLLLLAKTNNTEDFLRLAAVRAKRMELQQRKADLEDALRLAAGKDNFENFLQSFTSTDEHEREAFISSTQSSLEDIYKDEEEKVTALATISAELNTLSTTNELASLRQQESDLQESISEMSSKWATHALARQLLLQAKQRFENERQPQVIRMASEIFASITGGRWQGITSKLEENSLQVFQAHAEPISPINLSRGAQEQLYLSLRLAYIKNHAEHATALPVIMDDILVNFDPDRAKHTAEALLSLSQGPRAHQILFFTCHPHMADMLQELNPESARFTIDKGQISRT